MRRYSIIGLRFGHERKSEIAQCDTNPEEILKAADQQMVNKKKQIKKFYDLEIVDNSECKRT